MATSTLTARTRRIAAKRRLAGCESRFSRPASAICSGGDR